MFEDLEVQVLSGLYGDTLQWLAGSGNDLLLPAFCFSIFLPYFLGVEVCYWLLKKDPGNADLHFGLYNLLWLKSKKIALLHLENAIAGEPAKYSFLCFFLGNEYYKSEEYSRAIKYLWKDIEYNNLDRDAYSLLGEIYRKQGKVNTSIKVLKMGLKVFPDYPLYKIIMGTALLNNAHIRMALDCFSSVSKIDSEYRETALFKIGLSNLMLGNYDSAIEAWKELVHLYPDSLRGYYCLGFIHQVSENKDNAMEYFRHCLELVPKDFAKNIEAKIYSLKMG